MTQKCLMVTRTLFSTVPVYLSRKIINRLNISPLITISLLNCFNTWREQMAFQTCSHDESMKMLFVFFKKKKYPKSKHIIAVYFKISLIKLIWKRNTLYLDVCLFLPYLHFSFLALSLLKMWSQPKLNAKRNLIFSCSSKGAISTDHTPTVCKEHVIHHVGPGSPQILQC